MSLFFRSFLCANLLSFVLAPRAIAQSTAGSQKIYFFTNRTLFSLPSPQSPWFYSFKFYPGVSRGYMAQGAYVGWAEVLSPSQQRQRGRLNVPQGRHGPIDDDVFSISGTYELKHGTDSAQIIDELWTQPVLFFVHGYNMDFQESLIRAAQLKIDLNWEGAVVSVDWPTAGLPLAYKMDRNIAESDAVAHQTMGDFLAQMTQENSAEGRPVGARGPRHLLSHSMGGEILNRSLNRLGHQSRLRAGMFDNIIYAAPDVNVHEFGNSVAYQQSHAVAARYTLYFSRKDAAIKTAKFANILGFEGLRANGRLREFLEGRAGVVPRQYPGVDLINVDLVNRPTIGNVFLEFRHLYFASSDRVLSDIETLIYGNVPPHARIATLQPVLTANGVVSHFFVVP